MPSKPLDPYVLIPYKDLVELLDAPKQLQRVEAELKRNQQQYQLLRSQYLEVLLKLQELDF